MRDKARMFDEFVNKKLKEKPNDKDRKLYIFCEPTSCLETVASMQQKLQTLVVVGQPEVTTVEAISELIHLKELWIVECRVEDVQSLKRCKNLQKLYLYANEIREIPDLSNSKRLKILSMARNRISDLTNVRGMPHLQDINLGNNNISTMPDIFSATFELLHVNFSGNPLLRLNDLENLSVLTKLQSIEFGDPLYGECPLVSLCNYRPYLIRRLPSLREIDYYTVGLEERIDSTNNELPFCNKIWNKYLNNGLLNSGIIRKFFSSDELLQLKYLTVTDCSITEVNFQDFSLPHLESLDLSKNRIFSLRGLSSLRKLRTLCVSYNKLGSCREEKLSSTHSELQICPNLIVLHADHNKISSIGDAGLPEMPSLKYLFLQNNKLNSVNGIEDFPSLDTAILDCNRMESIPEDSFRSNVNLRTLLLENNKLKSLTFAKHLSKIEKLFVANNKIADKNDLKNLESLHDLKEMTILGNPLCKCCNQYVEICEIVESIKMIDGHFCR